MAISSDVLIRNNVKLIGTGEKSLVLAHGFGCDQNMWRFLTPSLISHLPLYYSTMLVQVLPIFLNTTKNLQGMIFA